MIRDTFETNPGLCELFKRMILDRAQSVGISGDLIDFASQLDMKGSYQENLRHFYRAYPQLAQQSDYFRLKSPRPLSGAALEHSWREYERSNANENAGPTEGRSERPLGAAVIVPELTVTYTIRREPAVIRTEAAKGPEAFSTNASLSQAESNPMTSTHTELMKLLLDHITATTGEEFTKIILHRIGGEIGRTAFRHSSANQISPDNPAEALSHTLRTQGLGRLVQFEKIDHGANETYKCAIEECSLCHNRVATSSTCDITRGFISRWFESFLQRKAESTETACVASGRHRCIFRITFRKTRL